MTKLRAIALAGFVRPAVRIGCRSQGTSGLVVPEGVRSTNAAQSACVTRARVYGPGMEAHLQAIVTVLSLINPAVCAGIFAQAERGRSDTQRKGDATRAAFSVFVILVTAALVGTRVLEVFGLSLDAFMVAGGIVLSWMGFSMLSARNVGPADAEDTTSASASLAPLVLFAASPGTITGVITLSAAHTIDDIPETALVAATVGAFFLWLVLLLMVRFGHRGSKPGLFSETATRFMGLIVLAMGVQFGLQGLRSFVGTS